MDSFGERLAKLRKDHNISQEEFAELLNVSRQSISKWENDKAYPEMNRLVFLSDYFQVSLDFLMRGSEQSEARERGNKDSPDNRKKNRFQVHTLMQEWNTFSSNLSGKQKFLFNFLLIVSVLVMSGIAIAIIFGIGEGFGRLIYLLAN
ncbi:MAG TPA: helix-turn-helix transcriptional regulator [Bacillota bacterium]|nr:helix-turn-helix transcriptional regulator [Bacillota bacterium]HPE38260.1 helix-turn-helix transcriptional regulator [Bacillota bacterium]